MLTTEKKRLMAKFDHINSSDSEQAMWELMKRLDFLISVAFAWGAEKYNEAHEFMGPHFEGFGMYLAEMLEEAKYLAQVLGNSAHPNTFY